MIFLCVITFHNDFKSNLDLTSVIHANPKYSNYLNGTARCLTMHICCYVSINYEKQYFLCSIFSWSIGNIYILRSYNELAYRWVADDRWTYRKTFVLTSAILQERAIFLVFEVCMHYLPFIKLYFKYIYMALCLIVDGF